MSPSHDRAQIDLAGYPLRLSSGYRVVALAELSASQRIAVSGAGAHHLTDALLLPMDGHAGAPKAVSLETAATLSLLRRPTSAAELARRVEHAPALEELLGLVLEGVLEMELDEGFVRGLPAYRFLVDPLGFGESIATDDLTRAAMTYAAALDLDDAERLAFRLYVYNSLPLTPRWADLIPNDAATEVYLDLQDGGKTRQMLDRSWRRVHSPPMTDEWSLWRPLRDGRSRGQGLIQHKLYLSPQPDGTRAALATLVKTLNAAGSPCWLKVARSPRGLLRPDKVVLYLESADELNEIAKELATMLRGQLAQGVPFTAAFGPQPALISGGMDPPVEWSSGPGLPQHSWRSWVTTRLASSMVQASRQGEGADAWRFAALRLHLDGIDVSTWQASADVWGPTQPVELQ